MAGMGHDDIDRIAELICHVSANRTIDAFFATRDKQPTMFRNFWTFLALAAKSDCDHGE